MPLEKNSTRNKDESDILKNKRFRPEKEVVANCARKTVPLLTLSAEEGDQLCHIGNEVAKTMPFENKKEHSFFHPMIFYANNETKL